MHFPNPHFINELHADIRSIKGGWYAMEEDGKLSAGPFATRGECIGECISKEDPAKARPAIGITPGWPQF